LGAECRGPRSGGSIRACTGLPRQSVTRRRVFPTPCWIAACSTFGHRTVAEACEPVFSTEMETEWGSTFGPYRPCVCSRLEMVCSHQTCNSHTDSTRVRRRSRDWYHKMHTLSQVSQHTSQRGKRPRMCSRLEMVCSHQTCDSHTDSTRARCRSRDWYHNMHTLSQVSQHTSQRGKRPCVCSRLDMVSPHQTCNSHTDSMRVRCRSRTWCHKMH
jgi:hypothetical protein